MYLYIKEFTFICYISYIYICQKYTYIFVVYYTCMCFLHIHMLFIHSNVVYTYWCMYIHFFTCMLVYLHTYIYIYICVCVCACACVITRDDDTIKQQRYTICPPGCDLNAPRGGTIKYICRYRSMRPHHLPAESHS